MTTTRDDIRAWINRGKADGKAYMIVVCDTFDWDDFPIFVEAGADIKKAIDAERHKSMQKVMEVYDLNGDIDAQLEQRRVWSVPA